MLKPLTDDVTACFGGFAPLVNMGRWKARSVIEWAFARLSVVPRRRPERRYTCRSWLRVKR